MARKLNYIAALLCMVIAGLLCYQMGLRAGWPWAAGAAAVGILHLLFPAKAGQSRSAPVSQAGPSMPQSVPMKLGLPTELALLNEEGGDLALWDIYGKNGIVIGRDVGENQVTVNLDHTEYASMIDVEHAVLNYTRDAWYVEDVSSKNGVSVQKSDGRKYKLTYGKPCRLEQGDIIYIGLARLRLR